MNDQQIIDFVRTTGKARIVQVSDKFDVPPQEAADRLRELARDGKLKESSGFAPNGLKCPVFDVPEAAPSMTASGFPIPSTRVHAAPPAEVQEVTPVAAEPPPEVFSDAPKLTKAEQVIAFIREHGEATSSDLHRLLGLKPEEYASSYLNAPLKDGRLVRDGKIWKLGDGTPMAPTPKAKSLREQSISPAKADGPVAQFSGTDAHAKIEISAIPAPKQPEPAPVASSVSPAFRVGLWSDGVIELQRGGQTVATMSQGESEQLLSFIATAQVPRAA
jgi:hypothetical protein